ncbi:MAG: SH3-like domain-containing protein [Chloroflexi bacterium]|nr:SH3-like domain-containing protein [Chloroflexota bacterium]
MALVKELIEIKRLIDKGEEILAKARLLDFLDFNPESADAWWLAFLLTEPEDDRKTVLDRVLSLDRHHLEARRAMEKWQPKKTPTPAKPATKQVASTAEPSAIMNAAVLSYLQKGYSVTTISQARTVLEKRTGLSWTVAITIAILTGGLGLIVVFANFFLRRRHRIVLDLLPNNRVTVSGSVPTRVIDMNAASRGQVPTPQISVVRAYVYGTIILAVACGVLSAALVYFAVQEAELAVGDSAYVVGDPGEQCIQANIIPVENGGRRSRLAVGTEVEIVEIDETFGETWYRVEIDGIVQGWLPEEHLSSDAPSLSAGINACE